MEKRGLDRGHNSEREKGFAPPPAHDERLLTQVEASEAPMVVPYFPLEHGVQSKEDTEPRTVEYLPCGQRTQLVSDFDPVAV